jgi:hypothetical protein
MGKEGAQPVYLAVSLPKVNCTTLQSFAHLHVLFLADISRVLSVWVLLWTRVRQIKSAIGGVRYLPVVCMLGSSLAEARWIALGRCGERAAKADEEY